MSKLKKLFGGLNMSWKNVIIFSIIAGVYTGLIMLVPFLNETSFQDIGISYEWWVLFAVIIVTNCKKGTEAMLKCFVFFLISQPLVYLVEVLAGHIALSQGINYYVGIWLKPTILTLPGGLIAYYCKKQNILGCIILALGCVITGFMGLSFIIQTIDSFPHHLLSAIFSFGSIILMINSIQQTKKNRIITYALTFGILLVGSILVKALGLYIVSGIF